MTSDRVQILEMAAPPSLPHKCAICGWTGPDSSQGIRKWIDIQLYVDFYGVVYFCENCIVDLAKAVGYVPVEELYTAKSDLENALGKNLILEEKGNALRQFISDNLSDNNGPDSASNDSVPTGDSKPAADEIQGPGRPTGSKSAARTKSTAKSLKSGDHEKSDTAEHNTERGHKDVPSDAGSNRDKLNALLSDSG